MLIIITIITIITISMIIIKYSDNSTVTKERLKRPKSSTATSLNRDVPRMATAAGEFRETES